MKKFFLLLLFPFLLLCFYNVSISINHFVKIEQLKKINHENLKYYTVKNKNEYIYKTEIFYSTDRLLYQAQVALIYIYLKKTVKLSDLDSLSVSIMHNYNNESKTLNLKNSDFVVANNTIQHNGYICYKAKEGIKMFFVGENEISFTIKNIKLNVPQEDIIIMLDFPFNKGVTTPILYLVKAIKWGIATIGILIFAYIIKLIRNKR